MFRAWKARRQRMDARLAMWRAGGRQRWARLQWREAQAKLDWNKAESRLRRSWPRRAARS